MAGICVWVLTLLNVCLMYDRPRPVSQKTRKKRMQTRPCLSFRVFEETSLGELSDSDVVFLNEAGAVLISFCLLFLDQARKSKWGYRGKAPAEIMDSLCCYVILLYSIQTATPAG